MTIRDYLDVFSRRKWVVLATLVLVVAIAIIATILTTPTYRASTTLRVLSVSGGSSSDWVAYDTRQLERLMNTYAEFAISRPVMQALADRLGLAHWPIVAVEPIVGTELIRVTTEALDPVVARDAANTLAEILIAESRALYSGSGKTAQQILDEQLVQVRKELDQAWTDYESLVARAPEDTERIAAASRAIELKEATYGQLLEQYERNRVREAVLANTLSVVEPAVTPQNSARPRRELNLALGLVAGLVSGLVLAFLLENLDTTLYTAEQIKRITQLPVLGSVPTAGRQEPSGLFVGDSPPAEAFRRLRTSLTTLDRNSPLRTLLVTSSQPKEGKSTIAANLAFAVAQSGRKVILVDAHLRMPTLHRFFELPNRVGLSSVLEGKVSLDEAVQTSNIAGVYVLTSGPLPVNPAELLSSPQMTQLVERLGQQFALVLLDSPSLLAVTDAAAISLNVDGVLLVVELAGARQETVRAACQQLTDLKAPSIGVIMNRMKQDHAHDYYQRFSTPAVPVRYTVRRFLDVDLRNIKNGVARRLGGHQGETL